MKSVVLCGSKRFKPEIRKFAQVLQRSGVLVYEPYLHTASKVWEESLPEDEKRFAILGLTHDHFYKIRMADVVFLYNKNGYCGNSMTMELGYAVALGKPVYALSDMDEEPARKVLVREIIKTPKELVKKLK